MSPFTVSPATLNSRSRQIILSLVLVSPVMSFISKAFSSVFPECMCTVREELPGSNPSMLIPTCLGSSVLPPDIPAASIPAITITIAISTMVATIGESPLSFFGSSFLIFFMLFCFKLSGTQFLKMLLCFSCLIIGL